VGRVTRETPTLVDLDLVVFDFDGVMTDNAVWVGADGSELVRCSREDGMGISLLRRTGLAMLVLSTERHPVVAARCAKLDLECIQGVDDKAPRLTAVLAGRDVDPRRTAYVGNDVNDLDCLAMVGWPVAVADARPEVRRAARLVLGRAGGHGAVRELCDLILGSGCAAPGGQRSAAGR